jgi:uncharacterized phiE125 gp8 family phage protein
VRFRSLKTLTPPTIEPVTLAEAKAHCRVDTSTDDAYLQYRMTLDSFPREIELPRPPMASSGTVTAVTITYTMESQQTATLSASQYRVDRDSTPGVIRTLYNGSWPSHLLDYNAVSVTWWGGKGASGAAVEQRIKNAILWLVGMWYERRMAADAVNLSEIPFGVKALLDSAKWGSYQ